ncbi:uncharacterized protein LOC116288968 [Actinia tenebrosa]|uniref:Uncharacterized protein LOC116288968 n=1 Tax=Actinia tenebrosa TaxID=6105 RepID=A0A6P8HGI8_ACTTE|nr:uncharacterized protein LOC116288968 [Actinia tenebrosa]
MKLLIAVGLLVVALQVFAEEVTETGSEDAPMVAKRAISAYRHIGCYRDKPVRALRIVLGRVHGRGAVKACANLARRRAFAVFAIQAKSWCFSDQNAHLRYTIYGKARNCANGVGGGWANDVYRLKMLRK